MVATKFSESELYSYLENNYVEFENWGCLVALSEDRKTIFWCPLDTEGKPVQDPDLKWGEVTAPEPEFIDDVNNVFGTAFRWESFARR